MPAGQVIEHFCDWAEIEVVVLNNMSLDGVIQGPSRTDEDTRDGFARGGWGAAAATRGGGGLIHAEYRPVRGAKQLS